jgi:DNA recombination protein RmuC
MQTVLLVIACAIGLIILIAVLATRKGGVPADDRVASESRIAAAEARVEELRKQTDDAARDFNSLRQQAAEAETARAVAETKVSELEKNLAEQRALLDDAKVKLSDTFKALAAEALAGNNQGFLTLAEQRFKALKDEAKTDLDVRKTAIEELVKPLAETLTTYQKETKALEEKRQREVGGIGEQLRSVTQAEELLRKETAKLVNALKSPQVRGRWGEITLRRTAELAGMSEYCDFVEQESVSGEDGRLRPDMVVRLPAGREIVVDSKAPLGGFLDALEAPTDEIRGLALKRYASQMKQHATRLASKEYQSQFTTSPDYVVMFVPNDSFLNAATEIEPQIMDFALGQKVLITTPATFIGLLRTIAYGWRQEKLAESAQRVWELGQKLSDNLATMTEHLAILGKALGKSVETYNSAIGSFESRVLSSARKFQELGAAGKKEIEVLEVVDQVPRTVSVPLLSESQEL